MVTPKLKNEVILSKTVLQDLPVIAADFPNAISKERSAREVHMNPGSWPGRSKERGSLPLDKNKLDVMPDKDQTSPGSSPGCFNERGKLPYAWNKRGLLPRAVSNEGGPKPEVAPNERGLLPLVQTNPGLSPGYDTNERGELPNKRGLLPLDQRQNARVQEQGTMQRSTTCQNKKNAQGSSG